MNDQEVKDLSSRSDDIYIKQQKNEVVEATKPDKNQRRIEHEGHVFRYKAALKDGFIYECIYQAKGKGCLASIKLDVQFKVIETKKEHNLLKHA
jgi:hypothetical protein